VGCVEVSRVELVHVEVGTVGVDQVKAGCVKAGHVEVGTVGVDQVELGHVELVHVEVGSVGVDQVELGHVELVHVEAGSVGVDQVELGHVELVHVEAGHVEAGLVPATLFLEMELMLTPLHSIRSPPQFGHCQKCIDSCPPHWVHFQRVDSAVRKPSIPLS